LRAAHANHKHVKAHVIITIAPTILWDLLMSMKVATKYPKLISRYIHGRRIMTYPDLASKNPTRIHLAAGAPLPLAPNAADQDDTYPDRDEEKSSSETFAAWV
jgi:hypothetical protein